MAKKRESNGKIASYLSKYSNKSTAAGYLSSIQIFLRCMFGLEAKNAEGHRIAHDYEALLDQYLADKKRNGSQDVKTFSECLLRDSVSKQSARQRLTYAVKFLRAMGITVLAEDVQDIKRESKGGAATVDKALTGGIICQALKGAGIRDRAIILCLASSGLRIGELLSLDIRDIDLESSPVMITIRANKSKNKQARFTFITDEAKAAVKAWLRVRDEYLEASAKHNQNLIAKGRSAPVQTDSTLLFPVSDSMVTGAWETCLKKAGLFEKDSESGRNVYRLHSLRKFFISSLSLAGARTLSEHLAGHDGYLDASYRRVSPEYAAAEYQKLMHVLTCCIDPTTKKELEAQKAAIVTLTETSGYQKESVEFLREQNLKLQEQIKEMQTKFENMFDDMDKRWQILQVRLEDLPDSTQTAPTPTTTTLSTPTKYKTL